MNSGGKVMSIINSILIGAVLMAMFLFAVDRAGAQALGCEYNVACKAWQQDLQYQQQRQWEYNQQNMWHQQRIQNNRNQQYNQQYPSYDPYGETYQYDPYGR